MEPKQTAQTTHQIPQKTPEVAPDRDTTQAAPTSPLQAAQTAKALQPQLPLNAQTVLALQRSLGNHATQRLIAQRQTQARADKTRSMSAPSVARHSPPEEVPIEDLTAQAHPVTAPPIEAKPVALAPPTASVSATLITNQSLQKESEEEIPQEDVFITQTPIQALPLENKPPNTTSVALVTPRSTPKPLQRGFLGSAANFAKKTATTAAKTTVGGLQGGVTGAAKIVLGPFWDLIEAARDKKDGKEVSFMGKDSDKYMEMLQSGKEDPYGGGGAGSFATGLSWVSNVLLAKIGSWTGWAALFLGILGVVGPLLGAAPMAALLGISEMLAQVATYASLARGGLDIILSIWSGIRAGGLYAQLKDFITGDDVKRREQYLLAVREFGSNIEGVSAAAGDVAMAGIAGGIGGTQAGASGKDTIKGAAGKPLASDAIGFKAGAKQGVSSYLGANKNMKSGWKATKGDYSGKTVRTSKAESEVGSKFAGKEDELADGIISGNKSQKEIDTLTEEYGTLKNQHHATGNTNKKAGEQRTRTYEDYDGEGKERIFTNIVVKGGIGGSVKGGGGAAGKKDAGELGGEWGDKNWGGKETAYQEETASAETAMPTAATGYKKADLPTLGEKATAGVAKGFMPLTILLGVWKVLYKGYTILEAGRHMLSSGLKKLSKPLGVVGVPFATVLEWIEKGYGKFSGVVTGTNSILDAADKGGEKIKEDVEKK